MGVDLGRDFVQHPRTFGFVIYQVTWVRIFLARYFSLRDGDPVSGGKQPRTYTQFPKNPSKSRTCDALSACHHLSMVATIASNASIVCEVV